MKDRAADGNDEEMVATETSMAWLMDRLGGNKTARSRWARTAWSMLPWVITAPLGKSERTLPAVTSTSYLNGLRGMACVIVYNYHVTISWYPALKGSIGSVPFFSVVLAGHGATMIFFVLSGFVLSYSPLSKISASSGPAGATDTALLISLWSSTIRRGFRLFTPLVALSLLLCLLTFFTPLYGPSAALPWAFAQPRSVGTFFMHLWSYAQLDSLLMDPFTWAIIQPATLEHAWTLPFEYRGSLVVFLLCLACSRLTSRCRKLFLVAFCLWALHWVRWDVFCFTAGMALAELRFCPLFPCRPGPEPEPHAHALAPDPARRPWHRHLRHLSVRSAVALVALVPAVTICAWPDGAETTSQQPFAWVHAVFTPAHYEGVNIDFLYASVGAVAVLASLEALPPCQWLLTTTPFRYLGEISFSFYLLHLLVMNMLSAHTMVFTTETLGWDYASAFAFMWLTTAAGVVIAADLFWRGVDETSVRLSRKISDWLVATPSDTETAYHALPL